MKKLNLLFTALILATVIFNAEAGSKKKANADTEKWRYDIEYAKTGSNGMLMVKVWSYSKKPRVAIEQCKKNAVHGVIFKGYTASDTAMTSQRPLAKGADAMTQHQEFFDAFFADGGPYMKYVSAAADGNTSIHKVGKEYKTAVIVTVNKDQLRSDLEAANIIKGLSSGF